MLLVTDCNYIDEDRQVKDQFVYGVSDEELKKNCYKKETLLNKFKVHQLAKPMRLQNKKFKTAV